jgi:hypothetical protein
VLRHWKSKDGQPLGTSSSRFVVRASTAELVVTNGQVRFVAQSGVWSS